MKGSVRNLGQSDLCKNIEKLVHYHVPLIFFGLGLIRYRRSLEAMSPIKTVAKTVLVLFCNTADRGILGKTYHF